LVVNEKLLIEKLLNLGSIFEGWLNEIGVFEREDLAWSGSIDIYRLLRQQGKKSV